MRIEFINMDRKSPFVSILLAKLIIYLHTIRITVMNINHILLTLHLINLIIK